MASTSHDGHMLKAERTVFHTSAIALEPKNECTRASLLSKALASIAFPCKLPAKFDVDDVRHVSRPPKEKEAVHVRHVSSSREPRGASAPARPTRPTCRIRRMVHVENSNQQASSGEGLVSILHVRRVLMARVGGGCSTRRSAGSRGLNGDKRLLSTHRRVWLTCHVSGPSLM